MACREKGHGEAERREVTQGFHRHGNRFFHGEALEVRDQLGELGVLEEEGLGDF